ncbi:hypothetical protein L6Q96_07800 [Candidatus Binatia bacterium]|nr:hypothetical protein [Candidatus Binatia bacterium]
MRTIRGIRVAWISGALGSLILLAGMAGADVATERPGSLLMFPKVVRDGQRDTVIQLTNTGTNPNYVKCYYLNAQPGTNGQPLWTVSDFELMLTKQQPTHWRVSTGRQVNPFDPFGSENAGLDPGLVPPVPVGFVGALICNEVNDGDPVARNALKGEATIGADAGGDYSKYNAIAFDGTDPIVGPDLNLNGTEYARCPTAVRMNFVADGYTDRVIEDLGNAGVCVGGTTPGAPCNADVDCAGGTCSVGRSSVVTTLTILPCNLDLLNGIPTRLQVNFDVTDEFEVSLSGSTTVDCWASFNIGNIPAMRSDLLPQGALTTEFATVRISSSSGGPFVAVAESFHVDSIGNAGSAAVNLHMDLSAPRPDAVVKVHEAF